MDAVQVQFLRIMNSAALGQPAVDVPQLSQAQWAQLEQLAAEQKVLPMVYDAVRLLPQLTDTEFLTQLRQRSRQQIILQTRKSYDFLRLYQAFREAGVTPLVVKGILCRSLYPQPDQRPSSDEDLLIRPEDFALCHQVLTRQGLTAQATAAQMEHDYEIPYRGTESPLFIELHKSLFPPESEAYGDLNRFFRDVHEHPAFETIDGVSVATLAPTDHLLYLIVHALKHFLHSGFGIRQVCDIALYANAYGAQVDWDRLMLQCGQIRAVHFAAAIFRIGENHLMFDAEKACYGEAWKSLQVDELALLTDILDGGVYGSASKSRQHSSNITLNAVAASKQDKKAGSGLLSALFPPARKLKGRYPYLKKKPWLLPVAWTGRILRYGTQIRPGSDNSPEEALKIGNERLALLKQYGIIP